MPTCRINRATGARTRLAVQEETCWGELAAGQVPLGIEFTGETLRNDISNIESQLIRADRMRSPSYQGNHRPGGDINGELQPHGPWALIAKHVLGGTPVTTGSTPYSHAMQGSVTLPEGLTVEKRFGFPDGTYKYLRYYGCGVNEFALAVPVEGPVTVRAGLVARQEAIKTTAMHASPTYPTNNEPFNTYHGSILMDLAGNGSRTAIATITSLNLLISNSIDGDQFAIDGKAYRADMPEDVRVVNGNLVAFFTDTNWQLYEAYRANTSLSMELTLSRGQHNWHFTIPQFKVRGNVTPQVDGRGPLNMNIDFEAHRDDTLNTDILLTVTNADPVINTAA